MPILLGIDPSSTELGWAIIDEKRILIANVIKSRTGDSLDTRFVNFYTALEDIMETAKTHGITSVIMEHFESRNKKGLDAIKGIMAIVRLAVSQAGMRTYMIKASTVKMEIGGHGRAEKDEVGRGVHAKYSSTFYKVMDNHNMVDAVATAMVGFNILAKQEAVIEKAKEWAYDHKGHITSNALRRAKICKSAGEAVDVLAMMKQRYRYEKVSTKEVFVLPFEEKGPDE